MILKNTFPNHFCEISYINSLITELKKYLSDEYVFFLIYEGLNENFITEIQKNKNKKIAIHLGNEINYDNRLYEHFDLIFRTYHYDRCDNRKVFNISLGYNSSGKTHIEFNNKKKLSDRKIDVFFSGQVNHREVFYNHVKNGLKGNYDINFTKSFREGMNIDEYISTLSETKICLVPNGQSRETFRYAEALASGCIVITTENLDVWYYKNSPAYFIDNWSSLSDEYINKILKSDIDSKQQENIKYYQEYLSPKASCDYIISKIKSVFNEL